MKNPNNKLSVFIDTTPLSSQHATRGIGMYTRQLINYLKQLKALEISDLGEIIHFPFFDFFFPTLPFLFFKKFVVTVHDVVPLKFPKFYKPGIRGFLHLLRQKLALKLASAIITDSQSSKNDINLYLGIKESKIHVVYLAANPNLKPVGASLVKKTLDLFSLPKQYILYVGDINYNKNLPQLIKALKYLPDSLHLVCVGNNFYEQEIPEWQWIESQVALSNVGSRVHFVTSVLTDDFINLSALYSGAQCYIQPSLYEGFGLPILEAMVCKTPVVCSANSSLLEIGKDVVVFTGTTGEELAEGINDVLGWSMSKRENQVEKAYKHAQSFSWQKTAKQTLEVYKLVAGK